MLFSWIMVGFTPRSSLKIPSGHFTDFSITIQPGINFDLEGVALYKTRIEWWYL
jgi:hypothetical protein